MQCCVYYIYHAIHLGVILTEKPNVHWDDVAGLIVAKHTLQEIIILPVKFPHLFKGKTIPF